MRRSSKYAGFWLMQLRALIGTATRQCPNLTPAQSLQLSQIRDNVLFLPFVVLSSSKDKGISETQLPLYDVTSRPGKHAGSVFKA